MSAARAERRRQAACEGLEQRVRAWIVVARREVDVLRAQERGERVRVERADDVDVLELPRRAPGERHLVAGVVEIAVEPDERVSALARIVRPARRDESDLPSLERLPARRADGRSRGRRRSGSRPGRGARARARGASRARTATGGSSRTRARHSPSRSTRLSRRRSLGTRRSGRRRGAPSARRAERTAAGARRRS